jgi:arylsulfatase A-like enzyme
MYMQNHRSVMNGTPLDARFTNVALEARKAGYDPVLFGYTDTSVDPRTVPAGDPRTRTYEGVLPGFTPVVNDPWEQGSPQWGKWLAEHGIDVPSNPMDLYGPDTSYPGASEHASLWAPTKFPAELSETVFMTDKVIEWITCNGEAPFFVHLSYVRPHPPRRNPAGYHDVYSAEQVGPFAGSADAAAEAASHPLAAFLVGLPLTAAPRDEAERRQLRATYYCAQKEVDDQLGRLFAFLEGTGLASSTLVVLTSDHGEMGGDHWLIEKCGYWDESYHVPLVVRDPRPQADATRGLVVGDPTESVDVAPTVLDWLGLDIPAQFDGWPLTAFVHDGAAPPHWRTEVHWEWDFRHPQLRYAERHFAIPGEHCSLTVARSGPGPASRAGAGRGASAGRGSAKYVQFAADADVLPPLLFDLDADPGHLDNLAGKTTHAEAELAMAQEMLRWRMRNRERSLANCYLSPELGPVWARDDWR